MNYKGDLIVFEGLDGSGKSSGLDFLLENMKDKLPVMKGKKVLPQSRTDISFLGKFTSKTPLANTIRPGK